MGPTQTLGMRLSCNFVNVYTIAYRVQYTRASLTDIIARKIAPRVVQVGKDRRACPARGRSSRGSRRGCPCRCRRRGMSSIVDVWKSPDVELCPVVHNRLCDSALSRSRSAIHCVHVDYYTMPFTATSPINVSDHPRRRIEIQFCVVVLTARVLDSQAEAIVDR